MTKRQYAPRHPGFCLTIQLPHQLTDLETEDEIRKIRDEALQAFRRHADTLQPAPLYLVAALETGDQAVRVHWQLYVEFARFRTCSAVLAAFGGHAHVEPRKGTPASAAAYCLKTRDGPPYGSPDSARFPGDRFGLPPVIYEFGTPPATGAPPVQSKRVREAEDVVALRVAASTGLTLRELYEHPDVGPTALLHPLLSDRLIAVYGGNRGAKLRGRPRLTIVLHGAAGSGKSWAARFALGSGAYSKDKHKHWGGYDGSSPIIFDDVSPGTLLDPGEFKGIFTRDDVPVPFTVPYQSNRQHLCNPAVCIVTTNYFWHQFFKGDDAGLARRFAECVYVDLRDKGHLDFGSITVNGRPPPYVTVRRYLGRYRPKVAMLWQYALKALCAIYL